METLLHLRVHEPSGRSREVDSKKRDDHSVKGDHRCHNEAKVEACAGHPGKVIIGRAKQSTPITISTVAL